MLYFNFIIQVRPAMHKAFFISIPHSGERIPPEAHWLFDLAEPHLMCDVDRYVDQLYGPVLADLKIPSVICPWHRYAVDLNRLPEDVDQDSVLGSANPPGSFSTGLHWVKTTTGLPLMQGPISREVHQQIVKKYFEPFHQSIRQIYDDFARQGFQKVYHIDAHSMPSKGTAAHRDPGEARADIVVSDVDGKSCEPRFKDLVVASYEGAGFKVAVNWPYKGGRLTQFYGRPDLGHHVLQVELNRTQYMNEHSKAKLDKGFGETLRRIEKAVRSIFDQL